MLLGPALFIGTTSSCEEVRVEAEPNVGALVT